MKRKIEDRKAEISNIDTKVYRKLSEKGALENDKSVSPPSGHSS